MELKKYKLGDCLTMIENGAVIKQKKNAGGIPITRIETLSNDRFNRDRLGYADIFDESSYSHFILDDMDLIMSHINSRTFLGRTVIYRKHGDEKIIHGMNVLRLKTDIKVLNPLYAYYYFKTNGFRTAIDHIRKDAINQSSLATSDIKNLEILIPSIEEQSVIVSILDNLDRKIALNCAINQNLEALAKQLYDYWFVQFDFPDENGRPYKSSGGAMVWNEKLKREIPEGWSVSKVEEIAQTYSGGTPNSTNEDYYKNGTIPWINSGELNNPIITSTSNYITKLGLDNSSAKLYPINTILVALYGATAGKVSLLTFSACSNQAICGVIPSKRFLVIYLYFALSSMYERFVTLSTGSARDNISQATVKITQVIVPTSAILAKFDNIANGIIQDIVNNQRGNESLIKKREELLPLLMNGQVSLNSDLSNG